MRLCASIVLTALLAVSAPVSADTVLYVDEPGTVVLQLEGMGNLLAWPHVPGALAYDVYRVEADGSLTLLGRTVPPSFFDSAATAGEDVTYRIVAITDQGETQATEVATKGECIARRGLTGISVTFSNCTNPVEG